MTGKASHLHVLTSMVIVLSFLLSGCEAGTGTPATPIPPTKPPIGDPELEWSADNLLPIIQAASILEPKKEDQSVTVEVTEKDGYKYIQEKHNVIENRESVLFLGQNDDVLFPGAIIQGKDVYDFVYVPIITGRAPITFSLPLEGVPTTGDAITVTVDDPSRLSNVRQGINDLLKSAVLPETRVPAKFDYVTEQVYSSSEKNLVLGVSASYADASVNYDFDWNTETYKNKILSVYKQIYYTVDVDLPFAPYDFFDPAIGVDGLAAALPGGSMPMYVSSVSYGWMALLFIETNYSKESMDMALNAAYDPAGDLEAEMSIGYSAKDVLQNSKIQIIVYGGSTAGITGDTLKGYSGLLELIQGSKNFGADSPGVPISYRLRHLGNNLIAKIALTEEYTVTKKVSLREFVSISMDRLLCLWDNDGSGPLDIDRIWFTVKVYQGNNLIRDQRVTNYNNPSTNGYQMKAGTEWSPDKKDAMVVMLDLVDFNPSAYKIVVTTEVRDYDTVGPNEWASGSQTIGGDQIFEKPVNFYEISEPSDMKFEVYYKFEPVTANECMTDKECAAQLAKVTATPTK